MGDTLSLVRFDRNDYSVPTAFAHHPITAVGGIDQVRLLCRDEVVATHRRHWGREQTVFDPVHYVPASKTGAELLFDVISTAYDRTSVVSAGPWARSWPSRVSAAG